jgi:hypothetical protein
MGWFWNWGGVFQRFEFFPKSFHGLSECGTQRATRFA